MEFLIEHTDLFGGDVLHRSVVSGLPEVHRAACELADDELVAERWLDDIGRASEGELAGLRGVFRFAPAA